MSEIQPTFTEREKIDETILLKSIENMNLNYKNYLMENEINNKDDNSCEYFGELPLKQNQHRNKDASITNLIYNSLSPLASNSTQSHTTTEELSLTNVDAIMSQNLVHFDAVAKLIVIGDKSVGKSLLIERFLSPEVNFDGKYIPTERYSNV